MPAMYITVFFVSTAAYRLERSEMLALFRSLPNECYYRYRMSSLTLLHVIYALFLGSSAYKATRSYRMNGRIYTETLDQPWFREQHWAHLPVRIQHSFTHRIAAVVQKCDWAKVDNIDRYRLIDQSILIARCVYSSSSSMAVVIFAPFSQKSILSIVGLILRASAATSWVAINFARTHSGIHGLIARGPAGHRKSPRLQYK